MTGAWSQRLVLTQSMVVPSVSASTGVLVLKQSILVPDAGSAYAGLSLRLLKPLHPPAARGSLDPRP
eukprot:397425-Rhodomonas_salina.2